MDYRQSIQKEIQYQVLFLDVLILDEPILAKIFHATLTKDFLILKNY